jgi:hypothetical protein
VAAAPDDTPEKSSWKKSISPSENHEIAQNLSKFDTIHTQKIELRLKN